MKLLIVTVALLVCAMADADDSRREYDIENEAPALFEQFIKDYSRQYKDENDKQVHYEAFRKSLQVINESNKKNPTATYGINKFADYTEDERKHLFGARV